MGGVLSGLKVVDFSRILAGPFATMLLGDFGATVIKVERPGGGDESRSWGPPFDANGEATYFQSVNRNKESLVLDLSRPADLARALSLAVGADIVVENFRPGVMENLGLGYDRLSLANSRLIYCSVTAFGRGAGAALPGYDLLVQALGGLMSITGDPDGEPQKVGVALVDVLAGLFATVGILAALRHREATGEGQLVEVDLLSCLLASLVNQGSAYTVTGVVAGRLGNAHPSIAPYELYTCREGKLVVAVGNDRQFSGLCRAIGLPRLAGQPEYQRNEDRVEHRDALREAIEGALAHDRAPVWAEKLTRAGVPAGVVNNIAEAFQLAEHLGLAPVVEVPRASATPLRLTRNPVRMSRTPPSYRLGPPRLGASGEGQTSS
ncbi:MAG TPA: CoA transferase [Acidimicrobiales bacterium]|nr:CoA transferase [Acidimicrobiales bacterium]